MKTAHKILIIISLLLLLMVTAYNLSAQVTHEFKGKSYLIQTGEKGGKYIIVDGLKHYVSSSIEVHGDKAIYKGRAYPIDTGSKGGLFIIVNQRKIYLPKK